VTAYRFGTFEFDPTSLELRRGGRLVKLEPQPARALAALLARPGELVSREALREAIWGRETHVDFDRGITYAIGQVRAALGDSGENPRFVQTLPKRGFRFVAPVTGAAGPGDVRVGTGTGTVDHEGRPLQTGRPLHEGGLQHAGPPSTPAAAPGTVRGAAPRRPAGAGAAFLAGAAVLALTIAGLSALLWARGAPVVAVSVFDNETGEPAYDVPVAALTDLVVVRLAGLAPDRLGVVGNAAVLRRPRNIRDLDAVKAGVRADYVVLGQLQRDGDGLRFVTHVVRLADGVHLKANRLTGPSADVRWLDRDVPDEFARAVRAHVLGDRRP
jgi:DNA-binding winged helix-turn-helix (wHTH) protein/TolB-like protein